jgi:CheY-like chemotaxis protein
MLPDLSHVTSFPRLLIADSNSVTVDSLIQTFGDRRLDFDYDVCTSHNQAVVKLFRSPPPYHLIISSVRLAEVDDFFLLKHNRQVQPFVPFVITAGALEISSSRQALEKGAFDLLLTPLEHEHTVSTIRLGLWHNKIKALIASRDKVIERYEQHLANYPGNRSGEAFRKILISITGSLSAHEHTIERVEASIRLIADFDKAVEKLPGEEAWERLDRLPIVPAD